MNRVIGRVHRSMWGQRVAALAALAVVGLLFAASGAKAGCAMPHGKAEAPPRIPFVSPQDPEESEEPATIVGLWHVLYTATDASGPFPPTPFQFLESYKMWHADGTEFENAFLAPAKNNICYGVWKKIKGGTVKLHHIGLMFDSTGAITNVFTVDETDIVAKNGKSYTGTFDFKLFEASDVLGTGTPLAEVKGTNAATRITVD